MKAYAIFPLVGTSEIGDARINPCHSLVADIVCECLRADGDTFQVAVDWRDPDGEPWDICTDGLAKPHVISLSKLEDLVRLVRLSTDPFSGRGAAIIRSMATCRAATFGFDGQAFLCLRHEDGPPISPQPELVEVVERPDLLTDTDYFDGIMMGASRRTNGS